MYLEDFNLDDLIECRRAAFDGRTLSKIILTNGKFWDLLAFYKGQWHYIKTKIK